MAAKGEFDRNKLSQLVSDLREQLGMTQDQFALYYTETTGLSCTYGFVQSLENKSKNSVPSYPNMRGLAEILEVSIGELDTYLHNPEIEKLSDACKRPEYFETLLKGQKYVLSILKEKYSAEERLSIAQALLSESIAEIQERLSKFKEKANKKMENLFPAIRDMWIPPNMGMWTFLEAKGLKEECQEFINQPEVRDPLLSKNQMPNWKCTFFDDLD
jgi:transcriptional regulator with XRE-family HTH domain